ncbi:MAG: lytic murein transglycosylase [Alphaproteobacteria bacterium]
MLKYKFIFNITLCLIFSCFGFANAQYKDNFSNPISFEQWKKDFGKIAESKGVKKTILNKYFYKIESLPKVIVYDRRQPEFSRTFGQYITSALSETRRSRAKQMYKKHKFELDKIASKYGVQPRFIVAFWGLETNFGRHTGKMDIIRSLATLSHDLRRSEFFSNELILALKIIQYGHVDGNQFYGSWAGAFGQTQFMPSTFTAYAVDGDGDGVKDLWGSFDDIFSSSANFLNKVGWKKGETWGRQVKIINDDFDWSVTGHKTLKTLKQWSKLGVVKYDGSKLDTSFNGKASLIIPAGAKGPKFLVYNNFRRILNWNNSDFYALAVGLLSDDIIGGNGMNWVPPKNEKSISRNDYKFVQKVLKSYGYYNSKIDGVFASGSKHSLKLYQKKHNLPADGHLSNEVLKYIKDNK